MFQEPVETPKEKTPSRFQIIQSELTNLHQKLLDDDIDAIRTQREIIAQTMILVRDELQWQVTKNAELSKLVENLSKGQPENMVNIALILASDSRRDLQALALHSNRTMLDFHSRITDIMANQDVVSDVIVPLARILPEEYGLSGSGNHACITINAQNDISIDIECRPVKDAPKKYTYHVNHNLGNEFIIQDWPTKGNTVQTFDEAVRAVKFLILHLEERGIEYCKILDEKDRLEFA